MAEPILVVGALHLDVVVDAPHLPRLDETLPGSAVDYRFGGKGGNQALAAAALGGDVAMAGCVGTDHFGDLLLETLRGSGVDHRMVRRIDGATGMSVAIVEAAGAYGAVIVSGANQRIEAAQVDMSRRWRFCLLQNEIPAEVNAAIAASLPAETVLICNAAPARALTAALAARVGILIVNRVEAAQLTGQDPERLDPAKAAAQLVAQGVGSVIVTLGADGLVGRDRDGAVWAQKAFPVEMRSAHGAGDVFAGALAASLSRDAGLQAAARQAQAAAALHVASAGPLSRDRVAAFLAHQG